MSKLFEDMMQGLNEVEGYLAGKREGYRVHVPADVDVKEIRVRLKMTQAKFSDAFGFSLDAIKHWEGGRRQPEVAARAYLTVIAKEPEAVMRALGRETKPARRCSGKRLSFRSGTVAKWASVLLLTIKLHKNGGSDRAACPAHGLNSTPSKFI